MTICDYFVHLSDVQKRDIVLMHCVVPVMLMVGYFQIKEITEALVEAQTQLEKLTRDKVALMAELDEARQQVRNKSVTDTIDVEQLVVTFFLSFFLFF